MTAAVISAAPMRRRVVVRAAPRREPPFDDELPDQRPLHRPFDRRLPFESTPVPPFSWRPPMRRPRGLPDPGPWGRRLLVGMIETAAGRRPLHQLATLLSPSVSQGLGADFERSAQAGRSHWLHRASVRTVRVSEPAEGVAELCATVETGRRVRAIAMRFEEHHGRWRCTRLQLG
jgi:Family of unknown function (DUF6459)